jgi:hypothetical protein
MQRVGNGSLAAPGTGTGNWLTWQDDVMEHQWQIK